MFVKKGKLTEGNALSHVSNVSQFSCITGDVFLNLTEVSLIHPDTSLLRLQCFCSVHTDWGCGLCVRSEGEARGASVSEPRVGEPQQEMCCIRLSKVPLKNILCPCLKTAKMQWNTVKCLWVALNNNGIHFKHPDFTKQFFLSSACKPVASF